MNGYLREIGTVGHSAARPSPLQGLGRGHSWTCWVVSLESREPGARRASCTGLLLICETSKHWSGDTSLSHKGNRGASGDLNRQENGAVQRDALTGADDVLTQTSE